MKSKHGPEMARNASSLVSQHDKASATVLVLLALYPSGHDTWPDDERALVAFKAKISGHSARAGLVEPKHQLLQLGGRHLRLLNLSYNRLHSEIPASIGSLRRLQRLHLR
jgi:hypothetical protein